VAGNGEETTSRYGYSSCSCISGEDASSCTFQGFGTGGLLCGSSVCHGTELSCMPCEDTSNTVCVGDDVHYEDSCGEIGSFVRACDEGWCSGGQCYKRVYRVHWTDYSYASDDPTCSGDWVMVKYLYWDTRYETQSSCEASVTYDNCVTDECSTKNAWGYYSLEKNCQCELDTVSY
jgi:hypothetical protein